MKVDPVRALETPEGITLELRVAGLGVRAAAWGIDMMIRLGVFWAVSMVFGILQLTGVGLVLVSAFLLTWGYPIAFEVLRDGATPGKRMMHLRVVHEDGTPVGWMASFVRNLMRTVDMLPIGYAVGIVALLFDGESRRLGDIVARTLVVYDERGDHGLFVAGAAPEPPRVALELAEQRAVVAFAERHDRLTPERRAELADLLAPATGARGDEGVWRLLCWANWLVGRQ